MSQAFKEQDFVFESYPYHNGGPPLDLVTPRTNLTLVLTATRYGSVFIGGFVRVDIFCLSSISRLGLRLREHVYLGEFLKTYQIHL